MDPQEASSSFLTLRNLSSTPLTVTSVATFPHLARGAGPAPITLKNLHHVGNLTQHLAGALRTSGVAPPSIGPASVVIAENAKAFAESGVELVVLPFAAVETRIGTAHGAGDVVRLVFEVFDGHCSDGGGGGKFRIDLTGGGGSNPSVVCLTPSSPHRFHSVYHHSHRHLALLSTAALHSWQTQLHDTTPLTSLSIPGTHNSATCYRALPSVRCQAVSIRTQLDHGIRFLDVRCQVESSGELTLVHAAFPVALSLPAKKLSTLLERTYQFLDQHPGEAVIISLKREGWGSATDETFARHLRERYIEPHSERWWLAPDHHHHRLPTLGEVRGKCVLFRRFRSAAWQAGINAEDWQYNGSDTTTPGGSCRVQDFCEVLETPTIERKIGLIKAHLERSIAVVVAAPERGKRAQQLFVNFLSGCNFWKVGCWPENVARKVNVEVKRHLAMDHSGAGACGVVVCDFVGERGEWDLVRLVVAMNGWIKRREDELAGPGAEVEV